ncbi:MAG: hypothetical protein ACREPY_07080, partial [Rhodanobacteraceae bacterium]
MPAGLEAKHEGMQSTISRTRIRRFRAKEKAAFRPFSRREKESKSPLLRNASMTDRMPALFIGHGNPMNAVQDSV